MATIITPQKVRAVLIQAGFRPGAADGRDEQAGFVARTLRRSGREVPMTYYGTRHELERAVMVKHAFGRNEAQDAEVEMASLEAYATALRQADIKAKVVVAGAALGEQHTWRYVEVG
jgi:hypothetical protein